MSSLGGASGLLTSMSEALRRPRISPRGNCPLTSEKHPWFWGRTEGRGTSVKVISWERCPRRAHSEEPVVGPAAGAVVPEERAASAEGEEEVGLRWVGAGSRRGFKLEGSRTADPRLSKKPPALGCAKPTKGVACFIE